MRVDALRHSEETGLAGCAARSCSVLLQLWFHSSASSSGPGSCLLAENCRFDWPDGPIVWPAATCSVRLWCRLPASRSTAA